MRRLCNKIVNIVLAIPRGIRLCFDKDPTTTLFVPIMLSSWLANALKLTPVPFSIADLVTIYGLIRAAGLAEHAVNSKWNSPEGQMPDGAKVPERRGEA